MREKCEEVSRAKVKLRVLERTMLHTCSYHNEGCLSDCGRQNTYISEIWVCPKPAEFLKWNNPSSIFWHCLLSFLELSRLELEIGKPTV